MKILLIGGLGYIGSTLIDVLLKSSQDNTMTVLDPLLFEIDRDYLHRIVSNDRVRFVKGDVSDMRVTLSLVKQHDIIVYLASLTMPNSTKHPEEAMLINQYMAEMVGDCCVKLDRRIIFMSTCSNYGRSQKPVSEDGDLLPISMYSITKVNAERYLLRHVPDATILRCATAYGVGSGRTRWDVLLNDLTQEALSKKSLSLFQPEAYRPICHVEDIAGAVNSVIFEPSTRGQVYNVGSDSQNYTKKELADIIARLLDAEISIVPSDDDRNYSVDFGKIQRDIGFKPRHTPESAIPVLARLWNLQKERR